MNKLEAKFVTKDDLKDFFDKQFPSKEISFNTERTQWKIVFSLNDEKEVMEYWHNKGFYRFSNLTLKFEL